MAEPKIDVLPKKKTEREIAIEGMTPDEVAEWDEQEVKIRQAEARFWEDQRIAAEAKKNEAPIIVNPDDAPPGMRVGDEDTPAGWKKRLGSLVNQVQEKLGVAGEAVSERFTKSKNYLNERAKEMDSKAAEMGVVEKYFRSLGEKYNKLSPIHKLGVGVTLGVGTAVGTAFSLPLALAGLSGLVIQRAAGAASMFLKIEKDLQDKKIGEKSYQVMARKERALLDAALYTFAFSYAIKEGLEAVQEHGTVERVREWLGGMLGHNTVPIETVVPKIEGHPGYETSNFAHPDTVQPAAPDGGVATAAPDIKVPEAPVPEPAAAAGAAETVVQAPELHTAATDDSPHLIRSTPITEENLSHAAEVSTPAPETVVNDTGLEIPMTESHWYEGEGERNYVLGGTTADHSKTIREFFSDPENAKKTLYTPPVTGGKHVIGWIKSPDRAIMSVGPLEERNWLGMTKYVDKIDPNWLRRLIR